MAQARSKTGADHPFLAFLNTVSDDGKTRFENTFVDPVELCTQLKNAGLDLPLDAAGRVDMPAMLAFREAAFGVLSSTAAKRPPPKEDLLTVEAALKAAMAHADFRPSEGGFSLVCPSDADIVDHIALHFLDLINSPEFGRLKECARCTKMFLDHGRGRGRRWCDMTTCGNRAKAENFRARKRAIAAQ